MANKRVNEFVASCKNLGVLQQNIHCLDSFQDNPKLHWNKEKVAKVVQEYIQKANCSVVYTFDKFGVSGHTNHISTFNGVR